MGKDILSDKLKMYMYLLLEKTKFCPSGMKKNATVIAITTSHLIHQNL